MKWHQADSIWYVTYCYESLPLLGPCPLFPIPNPMWQYHSIHQYSFNIIQSLPFYEWIYDLNLWKCHSLGSCSGSEKAKPDIYLETHNIFSEHSSYFQKTDLFLVCLVHYLSRAAVNIKGRDPSQARDVRTGEERRPDREKIAICTILLTSTPDTGRHWTWWSAECTVSS